MQSRLSGPSLVLFLCAAALVLPTAVAADPPPWAPAHGRKKHDKQVVIHKRERRDCGRADGQMLGSGAGAAGGAVVGDLLGGRDRGDRLVGSVAGAAGGALLGGLAGQSVDRSRGC